MKTLNKISSYITGIVFIFSGFVKLVDPLGFTYKLTDYFTAFNMDFLSFMSLPLAVLVINIEFTLGFSLLFGTKKNLSSWALLLFMSFFTILTFILAIFNPVHDCGCFGDAIILTNWQTFWKNVFLMVFTLIIFYNRNKFEIEASNKKQWLLVSAPFIAGLIISFYCYQNLPIIDFRPYKTGTFIPEKMEVPEGAPQAEYETILKYQKKGKVKEFTLNNLPDSTWEWVTTENQLVSEGYVPPIHDFTIQTLMGNDITEIVLNDDKFTFLVITYDLKKTNTKNIEKINKLFNFTQQTGKFNFISLTASVESEINKFKEHNNVPYVFYNTDEITLKTIVRANPGLVLLKSGTILGKWHHNNIPEPEKIKNEFLNNPIYQNNKKENKEEALAKVF